MTGNGKTEGRIERAARLRWVPLNRMRVNPLAQRDLNPARISKLAASFDPEQMDAPTVNCRGGWYYLIDGQRAPRGASSYPRCSREELEGRFLGLMAFTRIRKVKGTIACQESSSRAQAYGAVCCEARVIWLRLDCLNPNLQQMQVVTSAGKTPVIPAPYPAPANADGRGKLLDMGRCPVRALKEMSGEPKSRSIRTARTNVGSPEGREPYGDGGPVVVVRVTPHQGGRESRLQGEGGQVTGCLGTGRYA
jgi:hypothetical protein